ncbi:MAG: 4Fe-4S dicluster domain-containing protein [Gemmatimonadetes bacterium]|nr:4Fe-4S dicluster domain-containing protein [Gemmatimonadota bacterium]
MKSPSRRSFLKAGTAITAAAAGLTPRVAQAGPANILSPDRLGVLVDTTVCIGCRNCEWACKIAHDMPTPPLETYEDAAPMQEMRRPDETALTVVNKYDHPARPDLPTTVKVQCMHCDHPACVSACIVGAISKQADGAVLWDTDMCIGCRYCMVACPFQIPAFEYHKAIQPRIMKCDFCTDRRKEGKLPGCVEACPVEALTFGPREELVRVARDKIRRNPDRYLDHIYGEREVGGTSWMYLADRKFEELAFPKLAQDPAPGVSESIQHGIFAYFVPPVSLYALLGAVMWTTRHKHDDEVELL